MFTLEQIAGTIDHTLLKADAREGHIRKLCEEALAFQFAAVCVLPSYVTLAAALLQGTKVGVATVVGFPLGANLPATKAFETKMVLEQGAQEVDLVINIGALKDRRLDVIKEELREAISLIRSYQNRLVKIILETSLLDQEEKVMAAQLALEAGADYLKTSTGFNGGATPEDVSLLVELAQGKAKIKASGGIRTWEQAQKYLALGAQRLGTSSSLQIIKARHEALGVSY